MSTQQIHDETIDPQTAPPSARPVGHQGTRVDVNERPAFAVDGFLALALSLLLFVGGVWLIVSGAIVANETGAAPVGRFVGGAVVILLAAIVASAVVIIQPGQTKVIQFFGRYVGTARRTGLTMVMPFTSKRGVSVRVNNFETNVLKVNDADGNPVEIAAIVVWQVADTARASFSVEHYESFVRAQSESALRHVAISHPYDTDRPEVESLRGSTDVVSGELAREVAERVVVAGVEVVEVRISHLAYAPEIAQAMLQRQQASAIVAARARIVEGAVGMVDMALAKLEEQDIVELDDERKAAMVSNLLVVLCGESKATPIVNTGSLYQ
ncbi:SPFH domain-containing protein [Arsenicicoccus sp. oral taxon 190]|uniref:SPFH domain-containing protein n=1 Tax=Arsenicicoccus sp. oral taxon 190 TaxID=1658671 RepID=UPI00067A3F8B|nr:SPFH domain-containing protein [Arsenicicoccus sp. oral taxon 190]AKT51651.1 band 7 protein [Arsenicicoccus sp. oral taxon 190]